MRFAATASGPELASVQLDRDTSVGFGAAGVAAAVGRVGADGITYPDARPGADLHLQALPKRIPAQRAPFNSHGQAVFSNGNNYITRDIDGHNVIDGWKMFNRQGQRIGTYDANLNYLKE